MSSIFEKLGSYQILTNLLPGAFFAFTLKLLFGLDLPTENYGEEIVLYYFIGLIVNRIGSIILEPLLIKIKFVNYSPYSDFVNASTRDPKIDTLSEMNNYTRSLLTCTLLLPTVWILHMLVQRWTWFSANWMWCAMLLLVALFLFSYRKQTDYVRKRVEAVNAQRQNENKSESN